MLTRQKSHPSYKLLARPYPEFPLSNFPLKNHKTLEKEPEIKVPEPKSEEEDEEEVSLELSEKQFRKKEKKPSKESSVTLGSESESERKSDGEKEKILVVVNTRKNSKKQEIAKIPAKPKKQKQRKPTPKPKHSSSKPKGSSSKLKKAKRKEEIDPKTKIRLFLKKMASFRSLRTSHPRQKYERKPAAPNETPSKPFISALLSRKMNSKRPKKNLLTLPIQLKPSTTALPETLSQTNPPKVEVYLDGQHDFERLDDSALNKDKDISITAENPFPEEVPKRRKRRTKKEMELFKLLQKAINQKNDEEHKEENDVEGSPKEMKSEMEAVQTSEKKKRKRRTKKEMAEFRAQQQELLLLSENKQSENFAESKDGENNALSVPVQDDEKRQENDLDEEFLKEPKEKFLEMVTKPPGKDSKIIKKRRSKDEMRRLRERKTIEMPFDSLLVTPKDRTGAASKSPKSQKSSSRLQANPDFSAFLTVAAPSMGLAAPSVKIRKGPGRPRKGEERPKKERMQFREKMKTRNKRGGLIYFAPVYQKWDRIHPGQANLQTNGIKEFEGTPGIKLSSLLYTTTPFDFFSQFLPDFMFEEIARFTNISAEVAKAKKENPQTKSWRPCYAQEIRDLFALFYLFELIKRTNISEHWSIDPLLHVDSVWKIMSEERFFLFKKFLSFYDKSKKTDYDKENDIFYKCKFIVGNILEACGNIYTPEKEILLQELVVNYEGVNKTNTWEQRKPRGKNEINVAVLKESRSGYIVNVILNEGNHLFERKQLLNMLTGLEYKGYKLYMDSSFTSSSLLAELKVRHIAACGVIRQRHLKAPLETKSEINAINKPGETIHFCNKDLNLIVWNHHAKKILAMSNFPEFETIQVRKSRKIGYFSRVEYKIYEYEAPKLIYQIIENLKGNDYVNKGLTYYSLDYSSWKWYYRVMLYFLEACMMNSYLIYSKVVNSKGMTPLSNMEYRIEIIKKLCHWNEKTAGPEGQGKDPSSNFFENDIRDEKTEEKKEPNMAFDDVIISNNCKLVYIGVGFCHYCRKKRLKLKKTLFWCKECQMGLCLRCFDQHKIDQIMGRLQTLEPLNMKNLVDLLIQSNNIAVTGKTSIVMPSELKKRFRRKKRDKILGQMNQNQESPEREIMKLKRKRKPYKKRKKHLNADHERKLMEEEKEKLRNEEKKKEKELFGEDLFEFSDDSLNERIKRKSKVQVERSEPGSLKGDQLELESDYEGVMDGSELKRDNNESEKEEIFQPDGEEEKAT